MVPRVGEPRAEGRPSSDVTHPLVGRIQASGGDVLDPFERNADLLTGGTHGRPEQIVGANV
jgi:hypothetical protein